MDQEQGDCNLMEYPTKFNKYRRLKEKEALSKSPSRDGSTLSNGFPIPNSLQMSNTTLIPNRCSTLSSNYTMTPVETERNILQSSVYGGNCATFMTRCQDVDCKQEDRGYQRTDLSNQPCSLPNSLVKNTQLLSYRLSDVTMKEDEDEELPLNLTLSSAKNLIHNEIKKSPSSGQPIGRTVEGRSNVCSFNTGRPTTQGLEENMIIEEHFQRSLGSSYFKLFDRSSPTPPPAPVTSSDPIVCKAKSAGHKSHTDAMHSVSGSVDDHFSKSLGDVWTKVKASHLPKELDLLPSSVDDHFAKALGDMWYKIQADKDSSDSSNSPRGLSPQTSSFVRS